MTWRLLLVTGLLVPFWLWIGLPALVRVARVVGGCGSVVGW